MALILKGGAIFLHIPKTGGNWVTRILRESDLVEGHISPKHVDIDRVFSPVGNSGRKMLKYYIKRMFGLYPRSKPFMFCFVRHPLSWYESWFRYMSQPDRQWCYWGNEIDINRWHPNAILNGLGDPDFNQFVRNVVRKRPGYVTELFGWYTKSQIDFVGKQENLREDLIHVLRTLNLHFDEDFIRNYPRVGVSQETKDKMVWDSDLKEEVYRLEYASIVRYGYTKLNLK